MAIRAELFGVERLEAHARTLADAQKLQAGRSSAPSLNARLADNGAALLLAYQSIAEAANKGHAITPAAEWLIDNYHLVEKHFREVKSDLPTGYYRQLPKLADGPLAGYPRALGIAWAFVAHTDSRFDTQMLRRFILAYQEVQPLTIGELWAMSITLRIVLVENLRRLADLMVLSRTDRIAANKMADRLLGTSATAAEPVLPLLAEWGKQPVSNAFAVQFVQRLQDQGARVIPAIAWLTANLAARGTSPEAAVADEHLRQGAATVTISNIITSLRSIASVDWADLIESISLVDKVLSQDLLFPQMDFTTRNLYRSAVEQLARGSKLGEAAIAQRAFDLASHSPDAARHNECGAGHYLVGEGRKAFETDLGFLPDIKTMLQRGAKWLGIWGYLTGILLFCAGFLGVALAVTGVEGRWLVVLGLLGAIPVSDSAVCLVNCLLVHLIGPTPLPALELKGDIPATCRTVVAVPTLLTSLDGVARQVENLEVHYLASPGGEVYFALLSDWADAPSQVMPGDAALLDAAAAGIARLNQRYAPGQAGQRFLLLHRVRAWNEGEHSWIGPERKRGKLHQLNRFLLGDAEPGFMAIRGTLPAFLPQVVFVITLDSDTRLPRESVRKLIGKMAHPLNKPQLDPASGRVVSGYGILQPRVTPSLPVGEEGSLFQRVFSSQSGIDPYSAAISDVYQDLLGEGSYAGKGIYDIRAFEAALQGRVPASSMLSHDLFEGVWARAGLASDVEVIDEFPARYDVAALRQHRWARGDWQLLPWIFGAALPTAGRWKMLDNLRRSLSAPFAMAALLVGWLLPFHAALAWTLLMVASVMTPTILPILCSLAPNRAGVPLLAHLRSIGTDISFALTQSLFVVVFLADQAWMMTDAMVRTLHRLFVSRQHLLEWVSHAQTAVNPQAGVIGFGKRMAGGVILGLLAANVAVFLHADTRWLAALFAALWLVSPAIALWASLPPAVAGRPFAIIWAAFPAVARWASLSPVISGKLPVTEADALALRLTARQTWRFFETFVTPLDNFLPPDNFQEDPVAELAHRTSPTNIGLYLLSIVAARDFGWIGTSHALERLQATLATIARMEKIKGHLCNWYDTTTLQMLEPKYISSVDSGNLAGHLIALAQACREWSLGNVPVATRLSGIADALALAQIEAEKLYANRAVPHDTGPAVRLCLANLAQCLNQLPDAPEKLGAKLAELAALAEVLLAQLRGLPTSLEGQALQFWANAVQNSIQSHLDDRRTSYPGRILGTVEQTARAMAMAMEFGFLLDPERKLLSIGYLVHEDVLDTSCYDLLASEARLASFFAIAKGDIPARHWFRLGRAVVLVARRAALISWSGSMFEYLMPSLVMRAPTGSLIEQTTRLIVRRQIDYGASLGVPWGISESAYNIRDLELTYQYSNFGVPGLGLKRGLEANVVIAPYATALAAMVDPRAAVKNLARLQQAGALGQLGFYEALDYTKTRLPEGEKMAIVKAYMAHHQGMTIVAIANALLNGLMRTRFHAEPRVQATELLLQERPPRDVVVAARWDNDATLASRTRLFEPPGGRRLSSANQATPATHILSNGQYSVMLTAAGSGYSRWRDIAITRWREDPTCDDWGTYIYLRDLTSQALWSPGVQPCGAEPDTYDVVFNEDRATFTRQDGTLTTVMEVLVSSEDNAEVRQVSLINGGDDWRDIEVTSYCELVLATQAADIAHPVFSKLFVETEFLAESSALIATRRKRAAGELEIWAAHLGFVEGGSQAPAEMETSRAAFLGRNGSVQQPMALQDGIALTGTTGTVLDPIFSLRYKVRVAPGGLARLAFWTMTAPTRAAMLDCIDKHRDSAAFSRAATLAWTQAQVQLHHTGIVPQDAALFQRLAGHLISLNSPLRASSQTIARGAGAQPGLWGMSISGDLPILVLRIADAEHLDLVRQLLQAHSYWRMKHFSADLVIINERSASYVQDLQIAIEDMVRTNQFRRIASAEGAKGGVFVMRADLLAQDTRALLMSVARAVLVGQRGSLAEQLDRLPESLPQPSQLPMPVVAWKTSGAPVLPELEFFNGTGGFADKGREYVIVLRPGQATPAPWINVISNPAFGFQVAAEGGGYTWSVNSRENQLTPWSNDPIIDRPGEVIYLRDEVTREVWSATAAPIRVEGVTYVTRHGRGFSQFQHAAKDIAVDLVQFVAVADPVKISLLTLRNLSSRPRTLSVVSYVEWVLGPSRSASAPYVVTSLDPVTSAILVQNSWTPGFAGRVAFCDMAGAQTQWTGDRREFIGRNASVRQPAALSSTAALSGTLGAGLDPCGAMATKIVLQPGETRQIVLTLGQAATAEEAQALVMRIRAADLDALLEEVRLFWENTLEGLQVTTPDRSMDVMLNGRLLYQALACRVWARSAFYQASGAYGFRDQLQDGMALVAAHPDLTRAHLLRAAARQFVQGDVQHWWWPNTGQGVRTRITDDRAWLAYAAVHYVQSTGDLGILDEKVSFLEGQYLREGEHDNLFQPVVSDTGASLYEHCALALDMSLALGGHGLPLMGSGDWNDGMNRVGEGGKGESVWLAWLHCATLAAFAPYALARGEVARTNKWRAHADVLRASIEREAWDGAWYRRGFYDDGTALGSASSDECRIDSIAQSWAVISGAGNRERARQAMAAVGQQLVRSEAQLVLLFKPPFDKTSLEPGYIKGYPPGIRENGGQYTHGALWSVIAFAMLGDGDMAARLFGFLNPVNHALNEQAVSRYMVEPYVVAADVYAMPPHEGRGGWTWYTGSAGWMQRAGIENILGIRVMAGVLHLNPCIPASWPGFSIVLKHGTARYEAVIENPARVCQGIARLLVDGADVDPQMAQVALRDDGAVHQIRLIMG